MPINKGSEVHQRWEFLHKYYIESEGTKHPEALSLQCEVPKSPSSYHSGLKKVPLLQWRKGRLAICQVWTTVTFANQACSFCIGFTHEDGHVL